MKKKLISVFIIISVLMSVVSSTVMADVANDNILPIIRNVNFISNNVKVFKIPLPNTSVSAQVYFENKTEQNVEIIVASYADNTLEDVVCHPATVIEGYPTIATPAVSVTESTNRIAVMVWKDIEHTIPVGHIHELKEYSRDARLESFSITLEDDGVSKTFDGSINHNNRTVDVFVPTIDIKDSGFQYPSTGEKTDGAEGYTSLFSDEAFFHAVSDATYIASACDDNANVQTSGTLNLASPKTISVVAEDGTCEEYKVSVFPIGYIINSNMNSATLRYNSSEIVVKDTANSWKYENNKFVSTAQNRNLAPSPMSTSGYWSYGANTFAIKDNWRYTKSDYTASASPASSTLFYSRLYADVSKKANSSDRYIDIIAQNDRTGSGSASNQADLMYNYSLKNVAELNEFKANLDTLVTSFDFTVKSGVAGSGIRYDNGLGEFAIRLHSNDNTKFKIDARAHSSDGSFNGKTKSAYTTLNINGYDVGDWHNVKIITRNMGEISSGKILVVNSYYIDDQYAGYTYSVDKYSAMWATNCPTFRAFYNVECDVAIDNFFTGFYAPKQLPDGVEEALASVESSFQGVIPWLANMYDSTTGGFHMAKSGKDDPAMQPGLEMTSWGIEIINTYTDCFDDMPEAVRQKFISFYNDRQDSATGYYIDMQGPTNERETARIQSTSLTAMETLGAQPIYPHPSRPVATIMSLRALSDESIALASTNDSLPEYMASAESYIAWIASLNWSESSWSAGDKLQASQVYLKALSSEERQNYLNEMFNWLESNQNTQTGFWHNTPDFDAVSGAFKIGLVYHTWNRQIPNAEKLVESTMLCYQNYEMDSPYYIRNPLSLLGQISKYSLSLKNAVQQGIVDNIDDIVAGINKFRCPDGAFSYSYQKSMKSFGGVEGSHGLYEGDIDATLMVLIARSVLYDIFEIPTPDLDAFDFWAWITGTKPMPELYSDDYLAEARAYVISEDFEDYEENTVLSGDEFGGKEIADTLSAKIISDNGDKVLSLNYDGTAASGPSFTLMHREPQAVKDVYKKVTTEFYIKVQDMTGSGNKVYFNFGSAPCFALSFTGDGNQKITYRVSSSNTNYTNNTEARLPAGEWHKIKVVYELNDAGDDATINFYMDNNLIGTNSYYYNCNKEGSLPGAIDKALTLYYYRAGKGNVLLNNITIAAE